MKGWKEKTRTEKIQYLQPKENKYIGSAEEIKINLLNDLNLRLQESIKEGKDILEYMTFKEMIEDIKYINSLPIMFFENIATVKTEYAAAPKKEKKKEKDISIGVGEVK